MRAALALIDSLPMPVRLDQFTALYPIIKTWPAGVQRGEEDIQGAKRERERERERGNERKRERERAARERVRKCVCVGKI